LLMLVTTGSIETVTAESGEIDSRAGCAEAARSA
jgi:hypothetical protein